MPTKSTSRDTQFNKLFDYVLGNQATWIANIGLRAGLFQAIANAGEQGIMESELARQLTYTQRYVAIWCHSAYAFEFLDWDESTGYRLAPHMDTLLLEETDPQFMGGRFSFYAALYEDYLAYPDLLRTGETWPRSEHDPFLMQAMQNGTKPDCVMITESVLPQAPQTLARLETGGSILEIGAGGGYHTVHYARRFPKSSVTGLEFDVASATLARRTVAEAGFGSRVEIQQGDANELSAESAYDLVAMNLVLHETGGPPEYHNVLSRVLRALKPGGIAIVSELPYPDSPYAYRQNPVYKKLAGIQIHEAVVGCGMITQGELPGFLERANFSNIRVIKQPLAGRFVMVGEKPG